jgi:hypothetical protein
MVAGLCRSPVKFEPGRSGIGRQFPLVTLRLRADACSLELLFHAIPRYLPEHRPPFGAFPGTRFTQMAMGANLDDCDAPYSSKLYDIHGYASASILLPLRNPETTRIRLQHRR